jgi:hypothetical protein
MFSTITESKLSQLPAPLSSSNDGIKFVNKPSYLLLITAGSIFVSEILIMMVLGSVTPLSPFKEALLDAVLLSVTVFPVLYFFVFRLLNRYIAQRRLAEAEKDALIAELHAALDEVKTLRGIIPICASCKKIRDDKGFWQQVEVYVSAHSEAMFSHGSCPECTEKIIKTL